MNANYDDGRTDRERGLLPRWLQWIMAYVAGTFIFVGAFLTLAGIIYLYRNYTDTFNMVMAVLGVFLSVSLIAWAIMDR